MTSNPGTAYRPTTVSPPGETLAEVLADRGIPQSDLARRMARPLKTINEIVKGKAAITPETALQLEKALEIPADFWLARESRFREWQARRTEHESLRASVGWLKELPCAAMKRFGWIPATRDPLETVAACLRFFGVASAEAWRETYAKPLAAFRTTGKGKWCLGSVAAWLRQGERQAEKVDCQPYSEPRFTEVLREIRKLTCEPDPSVFVPALVDACRTSGVAVVFVPEVPGCPASGATRWLTSQKALLALSLRYRTNDHLWFTFFHEAGHIVRHGKRLLVIEGTADLDAKLEAEADAFARDVLIPPEYGPLLASLRGTRAAVCALAESVGVAPGIVVGRMQKEGLLPWSHLNDLKVRYRWDVR
jgi:HTH-type transcriptional regulator / antitoxin HigA